MVKLLAERGCAKVNLFLRVTGRRADGYHELDSIFLPISIADEIRLELRTASESSIALECNIPALTAAGDDLATRAARAFIEEFELVAQVRINLTKHIPIGAGLGGGSSDAGTVLRMMASAARIGDGAFDRLRRVALALGADVPFFLDPRPSRVRGIGELLSPLTGIPKMPKLPKMPIVVAVPPFEVATAEIFRALEPSCWSGAAPDTDLSAILRGEISPSLLVNDLAVVAIAQFPEIGRIKVLLEELGARAAQMSGSGGAVFGIFSTQSAADRAAEQARQRMPDATIMSASTVDAGWR